MHDHEDKLAPWKKLTEETVFHSPWFDIVKQHLKTPSGKDADFFVRHGKDSVMCVCVGEDNKVLIERQYRPAIERVSIDYPAGSIESFDGNPETAARRELLEETGFSARSVKHLATLDKESGFSASKLHVYLVQGTIKGVASPEDTESIVLNFVSQTEILRLISQGELACAFCVSATFLAFQELGWLIGV